MNHTVDLRSEGIKKLLIKADAVPQFNIAIVIEMVDEIGSLDPVGYEWSNMNMWNPSASATGGEEESSKRGNAVKNDIITQAQKISSYYRYNVAFSENIDDFYKALTLVAYTLTYFPTNTFESKHADAYSDYLDYYDDYTEYMEFINEKVDMTHAFADSLAGLAEE